MSTEDQKLEILQGTLDMLILKVLLLGPAHGHAIAKSIERESVEALQVEHGSLYPALHRLVKRGMLTAKDGSSENNRKSRFYSLTAKGRRHLLTETSKWDRFVEAIARVMKPASL
jgi:transcriptional regulator